MITKSFAEAFAQDWIDAWNGHDLDQVLAHYIEDFEMSSPYISEIASEPTGRLRGKVAVRAYWTEALARIPSLHFELITTLVGVDSVTLYYRGVRGLAAEVVFFNSDNLVVRAHAQYE